MLLSLSFARPSRDHPGGYQTLRAALGDIRLQMGTFSCPDGIWAVGLVLFFFFYRVSHLTRVRSLTIQPVREVKSRVKLHSIYETLREENR